MRIKKKIQFHSVNSGENGKDGLINQEINSFSGDYNDIACFGLLQK